ncbi:MAG: NADH-quinone oxidoreductase subunit H [Kiritimatiellae bacterium]|nr:NADH-quinone oxidoreductase subunit H [Kiritimatiellia bacterium]
MNTALLILFHLILLLAIPPLLPGIINKIKALAAGRKGPPVLQLYYDLFKLARKQVVLSQTTTWTFIAAPVVTLTALLIAGLMVPFGSFPAPLSFTGDLILFAYLLALGRFFTTAAALDTGSAFEGMGAAREVTFACLSEPALFFALLVPAKMSGALVLAELLHAPLTATWQTAAAPMVLVAVGLFIILLAENCRIPVDDPNTHLELTMIHEVMVLDHSGPLLGLILYGASIKLFILCALFLHIAMPFQAATPLGNALLFLIEMPLTAVTVGLVESVMARLQMRHVPYLLIAAILFCGFGFILLVR